MLDFVRGRKKWYWIAAVLVCVGVILFAAFGPRSADESYSSLTRSFDGRSDSLEQTVVVPTLDSPLPEGKSAVWCASFQLAWDRMKADVTKGPIRLQNAEAVCARLNDAEFPPASLDPTTYFAAAGFAKDGIVKRIEAEMRERFPDAVLPELATTPDSAVAYGYLKAGVRFTHPFSDNDQAFTFTDSSGGQSLVKSFGIRKKDKALQQAPRGQVGILYFPRNGMSDEGVLKEFVLDLCTDSHPHQIVLARVDRKATLAETLADVESRIKDEPPRRYPSWIFPSDTVLVPSMFFRIGHHFGELEGTDKWLLNPSLEGHYLGTALQSIDFRMDRGGAAVTSEAIVETVKGGDHHYEFNRPFLVIMKKRGESKPFFVMWVENAELMQRW